MKLSLVIVFYAYRICVGLQSQYHTIHREVCITYKSNMTAGESVRLTSNYNPVCSKDATGTTVEGRFSGRVNCSITSSPCSVGITVTFCFSNITLNDAGTYVVHTINRQESGTVYVMDHPRKPSITLSPVTAQLGRSVTLTCQSTSTSRPRLWRMLYTWTINNRPIADSRFKVSNSRLTIRNVIQEDRLNTFQCRAREREGLTSVEESISLKVVECGANFTGDSGSFASPFYPSQYNNSLLCEYRISTNARKFIILNFDAFDIQGCNSFCDCDNVRVISGSNSSGRIIGRFCSSNIPPSLSSQGTMYITFETNSFNTATGFRASYTVADNPTRPNITSSELVFGRQATLTCKTTYLTPYPDGGPMLYTWKVNDANITDSRYTIADSTLTINNVRNEDRNRIFQCTVSGKNGQYSETTEFVLAIKDPPRGMPIVSYGSLNYVTNSTITLSCSITENGNSQATWTWRCGRKTFNNGHSNVTTSAGRSNLTYIVTKADNNQPCTCASSSSPQSYPVTLNVRFPPRGTPSVSGSLRYVVGRTVSISCTMAEDGNPQATWTWRCGNQTFTSGITNSVGRSNLQFVANKTLNEKLCTCTASSPVGSYQQTSNPAKLNVQYPATGRPVMTYRNLTIQADTTVTLSCSIEEDGNPQVQWTWRCGGRTFYSGISNGVGQSNLTFLVSKSYNNAHCTCSAYGSTGNYRQTSEIAVLNVTYPPRSRPSFYGSLSYVVGRTVTLSCRITDGNPQAIWTWKCGNRTLRSGITNSVGRTYLRFVANKTHDKQPCTCTASSPVGPYNQTSAPFRLNIQYSPKGKPMMSYNTLTYVTNSKITLSCSITEDGNPQATWTWRCGSRTFYNYYSSVTTSAGRSNLTYTVTKAYNNKTCTCTASSPVESYSQTSDPVTLTVKYPARIAQLYASSQVIYEGQTVALYCRLEGNPSPQVHWINENNYTSLKIDTSQSNLRTLQFENMNCLDTARYKVLAWNDLGNTSAVIFVSVLCQPRPMDEAHLLSTIYVEDNVFPQISFIAVGNPEPKVKWFLREKEGQKIIPLDALSFLNETRHIDGAKYRITLQRSGKGHVAGEYFAKLRNSHGNSVIIFQLLSQESSWLAIVMFLSGLFTCLLIVVTLFAIKFILTRRNKTQEQGSSQNDENTYEAIQRRPTEEENTYESVARGDQPATRNTKEPETVMKNEDSSIYVNATFDKDTS